MGVAPISADVVGAVDVHEQRDQRDDEEHHHGRAVEQHADAELHAAALPPRQVGPDGLDGELGVPALLGVLVLAGDGVLAFLGVLLGDDRVVLDRVLLLDRMPSPSVACASAACSESLTWSNHWTLVTRARAKQTPRAVMPISAPLYGSFLPKARMSAKDSAGMSGMIQAWSSTVSP